ncbi:MAG: RAMP superfamily CRISPR-associated protein [Methylobacter sp.]
MSNNMTITIDIGSYWHPGSGRGSGSHLDALVENDADGLPFISGRMLKGLLRDAVNRLEQWGQLAEFRADDVSLAESLFGSRGYGKDNVPRNLTNPGKIKVGDAQLPEELHQWLAYKPHDAHRKQLYREVYSTAINTKTGAAEHHSLRGMQVVVPLQLEARLEWIGASEAGNWTQIIGEALPLIRAVGAQRSRGYGRALLHIKENQA